MPEDLEGSGTIRHCCALELIGYSGDRKANARSTSVDLGSEEPDAMSDESDERHAAASPYSTGGGGTRFEHRLGAVFLVRLLTGGAVLELGDRAPSQVAFQQSPPTRVDDIVVTASVPEGLSVRLETAVRRAPKFIGSHKKTNELVTTLVREDLEAERNPRPLVDRRLAVAVSGRQTHAQEIAELAAVARGHSTAEEFFELIRTPGKFATRARLDHLLDMVDRALVEIADENSGTAEFRCWSLLRRLWILQVDLETGHEDSWTRLLDDLKPVAVGGSEGAAVALRNRLEQLSAELARVAGVVDIDSLRRHLYGEIRLDVHVAPTGWARLAALDEQARNAVDRSVGGPGSTALTLPRRSLREGLVDAIADEGDLIIKGDSGVGKSALVMDAIEPECLGEGREAIVLNLRHLPSSQLELLALLDAPIGHLFRHLTAPERFLVIDAAEGATEDQAELFAHLLRNARDAGLRVIAVTTSEGSGTVTQVMKSGSVEPAEFLIPGLDDEELGVAADHIPLLQRLVDNPRARELLRRPIVIDLLGRADNPGFPLSESQALDHIWHYLVRNNDRHDLGTPDAREDVMLRLASHAMHKGDIDDLRAKLDYAAVDGLRRSGLLLPSSHLPWERIPAFKHDLLRAYSVARVLLAERDPAAALNAIGAPRWTLPSARLACEILLSAPTSPSYPRAGRLAWLQAAFDGIAASGAGERWSDVPTEAVLPLPESADVLNDALPTLLANDGQGLGRLIRVLHGRYQRSGLLDTLIAEPMISLLIEIEAPKPLADEVAELTRDWLRAHVVHATPAGQAIRLAIRDAILAECAANEQALDEQEATRQAKLAARTPQEIAAEEERRKKFAPFSTMSKPRRRPKPLRHPPYQWIRDAQIEHLALLGPDLGPAGEAILRRIAQDEPHSLDHAVEPFFTGQALASYNPDLLIDLTSAYYIEQDDDDDEEWSGGLRDDGIRDHRYGGLGSPMASFTRGPFLALFRGDYRGGVTLLNRMLDHAALHRVRTVSRHRYGLAKEARSGTKHALSITGESRDYIGDSHVWLWYRGTGVGPYPCMSALQALEFVTEEYIRAGVPPHVLTAIMLKDAHNLAMPALALGVLVRHLEIANEAIDPYLTEPTVWELEFSRAINDQTSGLAARIPELPNPERRKWSLREVSMMLALRAEGDRIAELKALGDHLLTNARASIGDDSSGGAREHLAAVRNWAASLDREAYAIKQQDNQIVIQQAIAPDVEQELAETNTDLRRTNEAIGLTVRHAHVRDHGKRAPAIGDDALAGDLTLARQLLEEPPHSVGFSADGPVAAAASAVELHLSGRAAVAEDDLTWSATVLLQIAAGTAEYDHDPYSDSFFDQGADRSAARALPYLLLPAARGLRSALGVKEARDLDEVIRALRAVSVIGASEARLAFARSLDAVWIAPCDTTHLFGRCHHQIAHDLVTESYLESVVGPWDPEAQRKSIVRLDPPEATSLDAVPAENIYARTLIPALRATGSAAISSACCSHEARTTLRSLLAAHQRSMLAYKHGYHHSHSDSLVAARAALSQAIGDQDDVVLDYIRNYLVNPRMLSEGLQAIAVAAEERPEVGEQANRLWPTIMDLVLDAAETNPNLFTTRTWGDYAEASLIPNPAPDWAYLTIELPGDPHPWRGLLSWAPQVDRWLEAIAASRMSIDHLVIAIRELPVADQAEQGMRWIERIVAKSGHTCGSTYTLPEWLHERRPDLTTDDQIARWQRTVDRLVVAGDSRVADLAD